MESSRRLIIDKDEVTFEIEISGQAMAVPQGGKVDAGRPFLGATVTRNGKEVWSGFLSWEVSSARAVREQFTDQELEQLYRRARSLHENPS